MTAKTKILCPIFESHKLHLKTLPVVLWKASRVQRNTGHSALFSLSKYHPATQGWFAITVLHCAILDVDFPSGMHSPVLRIICLPQWRRHRSPNMRMASPVTSMPLKSCLRSAKHTKNWRIWNRKFTASLRLWSPAERFKSLRAALYQPRDLQKPSQVLPPTQLSAKHNDFAIKSSQAILPGSAHWRNSTLPPLRWLGAAVQQWLSVLPL